MKLQDQQPMDRRTLLAGAGTAGALAAATALLPAREPEKAQDSQNVSAAANEGTGYRLTDHVKQYYRTTRL